MSEAVLQATGIAKSFVATGGVVVLDDVDLELRAGEAVAVTGVSGCGKSTLMHILGGLVKPDSGEVLIKGETITTAGRAQQGRIRNTHLGFVYQFHHLLAEFSARENVAMPLLIAGLDRQQAFARAADLLEALGLAALATKFPATMSGGERQRLAVARALANSPACVLADEPTGSLDRDSAKSVIDLLLEQCHSRQCALLVVTHDMEAASRFDQHLQLRDGKLQPVAA